MTVVCEVKGRRLALQPGAGCLLAAAVGAKRHGHTMYQRGKIQEESMVCERKKHDGSLPLIGANTFLPKDHAGEIAIKIELIRSTPEEKQVQIENAWKFGEARNSLAPGSLVTLQNTARERKNVFEQLMEAVKYNSLGQISHALYEVGGEYRRNM